jgi:hypothetical protein
MVQLNLFLDGEKLPEDDFHRYFRKPPDVPSPMPRSALIVGAKGVGKTTLLRHLKRSHEVESDGVALHIPLTEALQSLAQTGLGPFAVHIDGPRGVIGKATALLAITLGARLAKRKVSIPPTAAHSCLPRDLVRTMGRRPTWDDLEYAVAHAPLEQFETVADTRPLRSFIDAAASRTSSRSGLLLLFDRADGVVPAGVVPLLDVLDQSGPYTAVVATRPGHGSFALSNLPGGPIAGDHFGVHHLGNSPRSTSWAEFIGAALKVQFKRSYDALSSELQDAVLSMARDSVRTALEILEGMSTNGLPSRDSFARAVEAVRDKQLTAISRTLQSVHPDFRKFLTELRGEAQGKTKRLSRPLLLEITRSDLFDVLSPVQELVSAALRAGALALPAGESWVPGFALSEVEVPPCLVWRASDPLWNALGSTPLIVRKTRSQVLSPRRGRAKPTRIFVAYEFESTESQEFRDKLEAQLRRHPYLQSCELLDGRVSDGATWAAEIRKRIQESRLVVADLTGLRRDVVFEIGFAYGLDKLVIPVVASSRARGQLPKWVTDRQVGSYEGTSDLARLVESIEGHLPNLQFKRIPRLPHPVPNRVLWYPAPPWTTSLVERASRHLRQIRMADAVDVLPETAHPDEVIEKAGMATLAILALDDGDTDDLAHYVCGVIAARPISGEVAGARRGLPRRILVLQSHLPDRQLLADSPARCYQTIQTVDDRTLIHEIEEHGRRYAAWRADAR